LCCCCRRSHAGAILYTAGKTPDIQKGVQLSKEIIASGKALEKLTQWICTQSDSHMKGVQQYIQVAKTANIVKAVTQNIQKWNHNSFC
jgi:thymidine phosphorylase